jgi:hypothetical protein
MILRLFKTTKKIKKKLKSKNLNEKESKENDQKKL